MNHPFTISILHAEDGRDWAVEQASDLKEEIEFRESSIEVRQHETKVPGTAAVGMLEAVITFASATGLVGHIANVVIEWIKRRKDTLKENKAAIKIESETPDGKKTVITITDLDNPDVLTSLLKVQSN